VLRRGRGPWSAGTLLCRRGEQPDDGRVIAAPWGRPEALLELDRGDVVERRARGGAARPAPPQPSRRRPLVYADRAAAEQAAGLLSPGAVLENLVGAALRAGGAGGDPDQGRPVTVTLEGERLVAVLVRWRAPSGRKAFRVVAVRETP
jgi:hypothetical protein